MKQSRVLVAALLVLTASAAPALGADPRVGELRRVGTVHLPTSCKQAVQKDFDRAVALLHSFFYDESRKIFTSVAQRDPTCAMAHWGIAMTLWHPIWTPPSDAEITSGLAALARAKEIGGKTPLEKGFIGALDAFYSAPETGEPGATGQTCHGPTPGTHRARAAAYANAMEKLVTHSPDDVEVASFYALALLGSADPLDQTLERQRRATETLERFYADAARRDHPGVLHYLIHGYDYPRLASRGLPAAQAYAAVAPWVPHALHMPSHIFTRLGMWPEVIDSNVASADAARKYAAKNHPGATSFEELHALDYLAYAYLQTGQDSKAKEVADKIARVKKTYPEADFAAAYATGAIPARYALERKKWADAASLPIRPLSTWEKFPFAEAHLVFARALGAARSGKLEQAKADSARMEELIAATGDPRFAYFAKHMEVQRQTVAGWIAYAEGRTQEAEKILREAADRDDAVGKHPVSPGSMLPSRELLADFLLDTGRPKEALAELEKDLQLNPGRFNAIYTAARAARASGDQEIARKYYRALTSLVRPDKETRPEINEAKGFLTSASS